MTTYTGTSGNDNINGPVVAKDSNIDGADGDDTVILGTHQIFISGPGNDVIKGKLDSTNSSSKKWTLCHKVRENSCWKCITT
jgi:Ca2+-binding RTX toxin-like protein